MYVYEFTSAEDEEKCTENDNGTNSMFKEQDVLLIMHHAVLKEK